MATLQTIEARVPESRRAECAILGAILLDNKAFDEAAEHLKPEDFSIDSHRRIYSRMMDLNESSRPIDIVTLVEELEQKREAALKMKESPRRTIIAVRWQDHWLIPNSTAVYQARGTIPTPNVASITRMATYGTLSGYTSPLLNSKFPS